MDMLYGYSVSEIAKKRQFHTFRSVSMNIYYLAFIPRFQTDSHIYLNENKLL